MGDVTGISLRGVKIEQTAALPDGRRARVVVGVPEDPYIPRSEVETVTLDLLVDEEVAATVTTLLDPDQESEARALARDVVARLESGEIEPTAGAIEPLANRLRERP